MTAKGKTVLITGSTDGVGRVVAQRLAADGARVFVQGRDRARGEAVVAAIRENGGNAELLIADLASLAEVRRLADAVRARTDRLDVLVNNAGIGSGPRSERQESADGHELRFAVNYLAGYLLTELLLPLLKKSAPARIVFVASAGQEPIDFADVMLKKRYSGTRAYRQSKLAQIILTMDLARELAGTDVTVTALHPSTYMATTMVTQMGVTPLNTVERGAEAVLDLAVAPALAGKTGLYFDVQDETRADPQAYDKDAQRKLRDLSEELTEGFR